MDEKLTPADMIRKGINAVADAENKGINLEKDAETTFSLNVEDDAVEFASFSIDDTRDTSAASKAGTRLPTVSLPKAKVLEEPVSVPKEPASVPQETIVVDLPEEVKVSPSHIAAPIVEEEEVTAAEELVSGPPRHSRTWQRNHDLAVASASAPREEEPSEPREKTQEQLLEEILADTPEERKRKQVAQEEGRRLVQDIFSEEKKERPVEEEPVPEDTTVYNNEEVQQIEALERFLEDSKRERRERMNMTPAGTGDVHETGDVPISTGNTSHPTSGGYFGVGRKSGFTQEAAANAAGGKVIESRSLAVDPTTLSKKELREYNRINRRGEKELLRQQKRAGKKRMALWKKIVLILLALIILVVAVAGIFFGRYYGLLGNLDLGENPIQKVDLSGQSETNEKTMNILLVGLDSRKDNYTGLSDSMILCTINKQSKKFIMTSFLRDSYVSIPGHGKDKLNAAYALGGSTLLTNTIYENYGIAVDRVAVFNFLFVIDLIDYLGGVTVDVTQDELPYLNMYIHDQNEELYNLANPNKGQINSGPGTYTLTGNQALGYARIRYVGTDVARTERQRIVLSECIEKAKNLSAAQLNEMAKTFLPRVKTDLTSGDCASLIVTLLRANSYEMGSMSIPVEGTWKDGKVGDQDIIKITDFKANTEAWEKLVS
ncbi:MAG: LCP family protein [Clostridia bacterium]|nr:LCP family protein [Clostridia bacterium]